MIRDSCVACRDADVDIQCSEGRKDKENQTPEKNEKEPQCSSGTTQHKLFTALLHPSHADVTFKCR